MDDAAFIVWLRNLDHARGRIGDSATDVAGQEAWLKDYFVREGDYYFIVETLGKIAVGAYGIYNVTGDGGESGRWVIHPEVPAALPNSILACDLAFGVLGLKELRASTVATNRSVLSLNRKLGYHQTHVELAGRFIGGKPVDLVHFILTAADWFKVRERMLPLAQLAETQIRAWEQKHRLAPQV
jgi:RimJ/RimL family protein N-acetyltransferase